MILKLVALKETFKNNLPFSQCSPVKPEGHKHRYFFSVNPDWQVPLLWQRGLSQALFKEQKSGLICNKSYAKPSWSSVNYKLQDEDDDDGDKIGSLNNDDVEDNENVEKANRFSLPNFKTNNFASGLSLMVYFVRWCRFMTCLMSRFWTTISIFFFLLLLFFNLDTVL